MAAAAARQQMLQAGASGGANPTARTAPFYPTPSFQNHIEQLGKLTRFINVHLMGLWRPRLIPLYRAGV